MPLPAMSWMPKADRIAAVGTSAAPVRCNKTVAKINLSKMRTSCQINYPESPSKHHVAPTVGGVAKPAPPRNSLDHMHLKKADQVRRAPTRHPPPAAAPPPSHP